MATPAAAVNAAAQEDCTCVVFGTAAATCAAVGRFADDIADAVLFCLTRPAHVNISEIVMLATDQAAAATVYRRS